MKLGRDGYDANSTKFVESRPVEFIYQTFAVDWRIPLYENKFGWDTVSTALLQQCVDEGLRPGVEVAAVIIVPRNGDEANVRSTRFS